MGPVRAQPISDQQLVRELGAYVPTWLPTGFGLVGGWSGQAVTALWIDRRCHTITLEVFSPNPGGVTAQPGQWHLIERGNCTYGDGATEHRVPCVSWNARSGGDALLLSTKGVSDAAAARIRAGIALAAWPTTRKSSRAGALGHALERLQGSACRTDTRSPVTPSSS
jgi:hypothetical protein